MLWNTHTSSQRKGKQEVRDDLDVCVLNLQIRQEKLISLTRLSNKKDLTIWKEATYCMIDLPGLLTVGIVVVEQNVFNSSGGLTWPRVQWVLWLDGLKFLIVSHHFAKFCGHRPCGNSDTAVKIVYMTLQDHVVKGSGDFMETNSTLYIPTLPKLIAIDIVLMYM